MRRTRVVLFTAGLLIGSFSPICAVQAEDQPATIAPPQEPVAQQQAPTAPQDPALQPPAAPQAATPPSYDLNTIIVDFQERQIGDTLPDKYRTKPYEIVEWQKRHLPAPQENAHWTYIGGNYLLIDNDSGKILKSESGDIFFSN